MAGEIVYADLNVPGGASISKSPPPPQHTNAPQCPHWHRMALWLGWAGNVALAVAVITLGLWVQRTTHATEYNCSLEDSRPCVKPGLPPTPNTTTEGCSCNLCPADWLTYKNNCYWVSKESKTWNESRDDCSAKRSQMVMIRDKEEMAYILSTPQLNRAWLGLRLTSAETKWTWVDGSTFSETLWGQGRLPYGAPGMGMGFQLPAEAGEDSCGMIQGNRIISESCMSVAKWICEKLP